jgi:hypothetical protein
MGIGGVSRAAPAFFGESGLFWPGFLFCGARVPRGLDPFAAAWLLARHDEAEVSASPLARLPVIRVGAEAFSSHGHGRAAWRCFQSVSGYFRGATIVARGASRRRTSDRAVNCARDSTNVTADRYRNDSFH